MPSEVGRDALPVERIDATDVAEKMCRGPGVEPVLGKGVLAGQQLELALVHLHHQRVLAPAYRAVAHREFRKVRRDFEAHGAAVAASFVCLHRAAAHLLRALIRPARRPRSAATGPPPFRHRNGHGIEIAAVNVAPSPRVVAFERRDHRVACGIEMRERVGVVRVFAATDMAAGEAHAELGPLGAQRHALLASVRARLHGLDFAEMFANVGHVCP